MIDLHCHVLPAIDDGPGTIDEAIAMARQARDDGIETIAATPHVDWAHPEVDAARIADGVERLEAVLEAAGVEVRIVAGAEVAGARGIELDRDELHRLALGGGEWLLLECPLSQILIPGFLTIARELMGRGHRLLLAHPERSPLFQRSPEKLDELIADGALAQITAGALAGRYGRAVREAAIGMITRGAAHVVASDGHGAGRPAVMSADLAQARIPPELATWLTESVPAALLAGGERIPRRPEVELPKPRGRLARLVKR